jgi:hypothetical protein
LPDLSNACKLEPISKQNRNAPERNFMKLLVKRPSTTPIQRFSGHPGTAAAQNEDCIVRREPPFERVTLENDD